MHRHREAVTRAAVVEGYGSTAITMGWVLRAAEPRTALGWYWQALQWPYRRWESAKGLVASAINLFRPRQPTAAENLTANV